MAPTIAPKFGPTLRTGMGSTAGVMADGSPAVGGIPAGAKRPKTAGGKFPRVSLNLNGARRRTNPPRCATAKAAADAKGPEVIPSDDEDEFSDEGMSLMRSKPRKVGHTTPGKAAEAEEVEASKRPSTRLPATAASAHALRQGKGGSSISHADKSNAGNAMDDNKDDSEDGSEPDELGFGMQELYERMMLPGMSAA